MNDKLLYTQARSDNEVPQHQGLDPALEVPSEVTPAVAVVATAEKVHITPPLSQNKSVKYWGMRHEPQAGWRSIQVRKRLSVAHTSKGSPVFIVACVNLHNAKMLDAPQSRCALSQKRKELHPLDISQMAQTAEDKYAQACGADLVALAAHRAVTADKKDTPVQTVMPRAACR
ncbi:hypothetical protein ABBQ38_001652 [Trebouxia sp. C0009 RCD-2024]